MDANECLPLFCCGTPPQGGNFHIMGNSTCKLTILESMVRNFKKGFFWGSGFPHSSVGKKSACNAGDPSSLPGWGRSAGEGIGYPLQYSWASLVAQLVKNLPAVRETRVQSLGWEDPLEKEKAILAWRIPWTVLYSPWGCKESDTTE